MACARFKPADPAVAGKDVVLASDHDRVAANLKNSDALCDQWMAIATEREARIAALERELAELRNREVIFDTDAALDKRLKASGMLTVEQMKSGSPTDRFMKHAGVHNLSSFTKWLLMRREEALKSHSRMIVGGREKDELFEWVLSHNAVFGEVLINFKAAVAGEESQLLRLGVTDQLRTTH